LRRESSFWSKIKALALQRRFESDSKSQLVDPGAVATDGGENLVWPYGEEYRHLLGLQLGNAAVIVDALIAAIAQALEVEPTALLGRIWPQQVEVTVDHEVPESAGEPKFERR
jgi:hypothetical protein